MENTENTVENAGTNAQGGDNSQKNNYIEQSIWDDLPSMVKAEMVKLTPTQQQSFVEEYKRKKKSVGWAYFFLLICLGMPYGYLGKWGLQVVYWLTGAGVLIWCIVLIFMLPGMVKNYNKDIAIETMRNIKAFS